MVHDMFANLLLGRSAFDIESHWQNMFYTVNFFGYGGSETRAITAVDVALWDLLGQYTGQPIYNLLGGRCRESIWVYNTCVGHGKHQDYKRWAEGHSGDLAAELLSQGVKAMKIWPFDQFGVPSGGPLGQRAGAGAVGPVGYHLKREDLKKGVSYVEDIRKNVGDQIEICIEGHARWITEAVRSPMPSNPTTSCGWRRYAAGQYRVLPAAQTRHHDPLCVSERLITKFGFREVIEKNAADIIMPDMAWCGGISERARSATWQRPTCCPSPATIASAGSPLVGCPLDAPHPQCHDRGNSARYTTAGTTK